MILEGEVEVAMAGGRHAGRPGDVMVMPARCDHDQGCRGPWRTLCVLYHDDAGATPEVIATAGDVLVSTWMEQLRQLASDGDSAATGHALLAALLMRLSDHRRRCAQDRQVHPALARAEAMIRQQLTTVLDVTALARRVGLSHSHLGALFRARHGCSPLQWHLRLRLQHARGLLANPYASVAQVAGALGFRDANYFVRQFRAQHGVPPGHWRRQER